MGLTLRRTFVLAGIPLYNPELESLAERGLAAALAEVNSVHAASHLYRVTKGSVTRVSPHTHTHTHTEVSRIYLKRAHKHFLMLWRIFTVCTAVLDVLFHDIFIKCLPGDSHGPEHS